MIRIITFIALLGLAVFHGPASAFDAPATGQALEIRAEPIPLLIADRNGDRFGRLTFLGGLVLEADHRAFGGFSGLAVLATGDAILAVSDLGTILSARLQTGADGRPLGLGNAWLAPLLDSTGRRFRRKRDKDAEALAVDPVTGEAVIAFERRARFARVRLDDPQGLRTRPVPAPPSAAGNSNSGFEALAIFPPGTTHAGKMFALTERGVNDGDSEGFLIDGENHLAFKVKRTGGYSITDAAVLADGRILILERRLTTIMSPRVRLRMLSADRIEDGAVLDGTVLFEPGGGTEIDNMEGLAVHRDPKGQSVVTMISDDNFNPFQRTVLLRFMLDDD